MALLRRLLVFHDLVSQLVENFLNVASVLGGHLQEIHAVTFGQLFALLVGNFTFVLEVAFGGNQHHDDIGVARLLDLLYPLLDVLVTIRVDD